jgi:hypothetical protein
MTLKQMQAARQNPKPGKKLYLRKETVKDLKLGNRAAGWPCEETEEDEFFGGEPPKCPPATV